MKRKYLIFWIVALFVSGIYIFGYKANAEKSKNRFSQLFYSSNDITWTISKRITNREGRSWYPEISAYNQNIHIVWEDDVSWPNRGILYMKSSDNGETWSDINTLSSVDSSVPKIGCYENSIHTVWKQYNNIYYSRSINNGETWLEPININLDIFCYEPDISVYKDNIYIVWRGYDGIYFIKSNDNGNNWEAIIKIVDAEDSKNPRIAVYENQIHVVWQEKSGPYGYEKEKLFYKRSEDYGKNWQEPILLALADPYGARFNPDIKVYNNNVHVVWIWGLTITYQNSRDGGKTWLADKTIYEFSGSEYEKFNKPAIAVDNQKIHIVWDLYRESFNYNFEIVYTKSLDNGDHWSDLINISNTAAPYGKSEYPSIAVIKNNIHVVWQDYYTVDYEIWYKKGFLTIPPSIAISKTSLSFSSVEGQSNPDSQIFEISNSGDGELKYQITTDKNWISVSPSSGSSTGEWNKTTVSIDISSLLEGAHSGTIIITSQEAVNSPQRIIVNLVVEPPPIYPPLNFLGIQVENRSVSKREYINLLTWNDNPLNKHIEKYRIYQIEGNSQRLLAEVTSSTFQYLHRKVEGKRKYIYSLVAVDYKNREGKATVININ